MWGSFREVAGWSSALPATATFPRQGAGVLLACLQCPLFFLLFPATLTITYFCVVSLLPSSARGQLHALSFVLSLPLFHLMTSSHLSLIEATREKHPLLHPTPQRESHTCPCTGFFPPFWGMRHPSSCLRPSPRPPLWALAPATSPCLLSHPRQRVVFCL